MKKFKVYLFDFDGTLVDSFDSLYKVFGDAFNSINIKINKDQIPHLSRIPLLEGYLSLGGTKEGMKIFEKTIRASLASKETLLMTKNYVDSVNFINFLSKDKNVKLGIVTSNSLSHVYEVLDFLKIDKTFFSVFVGNDECKESKPSPEPILTALKMLNYNGDLNEVLYVGDSINDALSAKNAHVNTYLLDRYNEYGNVKEFKLIRNLEELKYE